MSHSTEISQPWEPAQGRAEAFGTAGPPLVVEALHLAQGDLDLHFGTQPVIRVMEARFGSLPFAPNEQPPRTPPLQRSTMLPEPIEFPVHDWFSSLLRRVRFN